MDPMESMSATAGPIPTNFNADEAGNMEDVSSNSVDMTSPKKF